MGQQGVILAGKTDYHAWRLTKDFVIIPRYTAAVAATQLIYKTISTATEKKKIVLDKIKCHLTYITTTHEYQNHSTTIRPYLAAGASSRRPCL